VKPIGNCSEKVLNIHSFLVTSHPCVNIHLEGETSPPAFLPSTNYSDIKRTNSIYFISRAWSQRGVSGILGEYEFFISK